MNENEGVNFFQGLVAALAIMCILAVAVTQIYKYGQRHPDPAQFVTYAVAIELATEREMFGQSKACK